MLCWAGVFLLSAGVMPARSQSLAEVARKEKERRARVSGEDPAPVIGERELAASPGQSLSITGRDTESSQDESSSSGSPPADEERRLTPEEIRDLREKWARVWKTQLEGAEEEAKLARDAVYQCNKAGTFFFVPLAIDCDGVHERLAIAEYRLKEIRANQYNWELLLPERKRSPPAN